MFLCLWPRLTSLLRNTTTTLINAFAWQGHCCLGKTIVMLCCGMHHVFHWLAINCVWVAYCVEWLACMSLCVAEFLWCSPSRCNSYSDITPLKYTIRCFIVFFLIMLSNRFYGNLIGFCTMYDHLPCGKTWRLIIIKSESTKHASNTGPIHQLLPLVGFPVIFKPPV